MRHVFLSIVASAIGALIVPTPAAAASQCKPVPDGMLPACSYNATNGNCKVTIDRMNPVTPPTIYVKRGCAVSVDLVNGYKLETLTLDFKSSTITLPPDAFSAAMAALSPNLGKVTIVGSIQAHPNFTLPTLEKKDKGCEEVAGSCTDSEMISQAQMHVEQLIEGIDPLTLASGAIQDIKAALQPPPGGADGNKAPWINTQAWKNTTVDKLNNAVTKYQDAATLAKIKIDLANLQADIDTVTKAANGPTGTAQDQYGVSVLADNQSALSSEVVALKTGAAKLIALARSLNKVQLTSGTLDGNNEIADTGSDEKDYQIQVWSLDYTNLLQPIARRVAADTLKSESGALLGSIADASAKLPILSLTVQFQSPSRVEVSTGLMIPLTPYHSYAKASQANTGTITDNVVQETKTFPVVPMAFINVLQHGWITGNRQRAGFFYTGGVGYNPATSTVEFGAGLTFSYRAIQIGALADIGRDTKLGGGFTVGQSLGNTSNAATPITSTYWTVKPSLAISVRIPIGGGGK